MKKKNRKKKSKPARKSQKKAPKTEPLVLPRRRLLIAMINGEHERDKIETALAVNLITPEWLTLVDVPTSAWQEQFDEWKRLFAAWKKIEAKR